MAAQGVDSPRRPASPRKAPLIPSWDLNETVLTAAAGELRRAHAVRVSSVIVDVTNPAQVNTWIGTVEHEDGGGDVLINDPGFIRDNRIEQITDADWDMVLDVSLKGVPPRWMCAPMCALRPEIRVVTRRPDEDRATTDQKVGSSSLFGRTLC